jgi:DNA-binding GntR family transcriptional regulator
LPEQIATAIVLMIAGGALLPGQRLVETELAARLRTSRAPLREAMRRLEAQGILSTTPYRGTRVVSFDPASQAQVTEARIALEKLVIRQAAAVLREAPARAGELDAVLADMRRCVAARDRLGLNRADVAFHRAMCRIADNPVLLALWEAIANHVLISFGLSNARYPDSQAVLEQHLRLRANLASAELGALEGIAERHVLGRDLPVAEPSKSKGGRNHV